MPSYSITAKRKTEPFDRAYFQIDARNIGEAYYAMIENPSILGFEIIAIDSVVY
jgi:hypothetical protein